MKQRPEHISDLLFEQRDSEVFNIPDTKTRLATLQNYFFPRLDFLLRDTLALIQEIYGVNPYEKITFVYRPSNRATAHSNIDFRQVHIGLSAKRRIDRPLKIARIDGTPFRLHPSYLTYTIDPMGGMCVELLPFRQRVDQQFKSAIADLVQSHLHLLNPLFSLHHISHSSAKEFLDFNQAFTLESLLRFDILLYSPTYYFPLTNDRGLAVLQAAFISLYPLLDSFISVGEGEAPRLGEMLSQLREWYSSDLGGTQDSAPDPIIEECVSIPELESYAFVRAGVWWQVLARDNWKCCSCGRNAIADGVTLEVDHILPRSLGGTDDITNLQTLCKKCNIGKSNRDSTDLRTIIASKTDT